MANNFNELFKEINKVVAKAMNTKVASTVKKVEQESLDEDTYSKYTPRFYERRYEQGGLKDTRNMHHTISENGSEMVLEVENITKKSSDSSAYLAPDIEYGYGSKSQPYNVPRPFTKGTHDRLQDTQEHVKALKDGLRSEGIDVD